MTLFEKPTNDSLYDRSAIRHTFIDLTPAPNEDQLSQSSIVGYVYGIRNNVKNLYYIGQSTNYWNRGSCHIRMALSNKSNDCKSKVDAAMSVEGIENFTMFKLWACTSLDELLDKEYEFICKYNSTNPANGYNIWAARDSFYGRYKSRKRNSTSASIESKRSRSRRAVAINLNTKQIIIAASLKLLGEVIFGKTRDHIAHAAHNPHMIAGYYILYYDHDVGAEVWRRQMNVYNNAKPGKGQCIKGRDEEYRLLYQIIHGRDFKIFANDNFQFFEIDFSEFSPGFSFRRLSYDTEACAFIITEDVTFDYTYPLLK